MKIAVLCTSRGLVFADTIDSLIENLKGYNWEFISVSGLPIPEAQNEAVKRALKGSSDYFFWVEEDVVIPSGSLKART